MVAPKYEIHFSEMSSLRALHAAHEKASVELMQWYKDNGLRPIRFRIPTHFYIHFQCIRRARKIQTMPEGLYEYHSRVVRAGTRRGNRII